MCTLQGDALSLTGKAAYYNNIIPMLFAPDAFKEQLMALPEEYLAEYPVPYVMTQVTLGLLRMAAMREARNLQTDTRFLRG